MALNTVVELFYFQGGACVTIYIDLNSSLRQNIVPDPGLTAVEGTLLPWRGITGRIMIALRLEKLLFLSQFEYLDQLGKCDRGS